MRRHALLILAFGLLALLARWPGLDRSLWYDELFTLVHFTSSPAEAVTRQLAANNHPLASILAWAARSISGGSLVGIRTPFLLLGAVSVPALLAQRRLLGSRGAVLAAALAALAPLHVAYAQQVRGYAGVLLAATLLIPLVESNLREDARRTRVALIACVALGAYSHLSLAWLALALLGVSALAPWLGLAGSASSRWTAGALGAGLGIAGLAYLPLLGRTLKFARRALAEGDPGAAGRLGLGDVSHLLGGGGLATVLSVLALVGLQTLWQRGDRRAAALLGAPLLAGLSLVALGAPAYPRFLLFLLPALLGLAGCGLARLPSKAAVIGLAVCLLLSAVEVIQRAGDELQDYRGAARVAAEQAPACRPLAIRPGSGVLLGALLDPPPVEVADERTLEAWLEQPAPLVAIDDFPRLTSPTLQAKVRSRLGPPLVLPGRVSPIAVYVLRTP